MDSFADYLLVLLGTMLRFIWFCTVSSQFLQDLDIRIFTTIVFPYILQDLDIRIYTTIVFPLYMHISYSYDMKVATKEWSIAEKIFRLSWESNPVLPVKNPML